MRPWAIAGLLLVALAVPVLIRSANLFPSREASTALTLLAADLDDYARAHESRYPISFEELFAAGFTSFAGDSRDPWGREYQYERHPIDPTRCRAWTLGPDAKPAEYEGGDDVVLYKIRTRTIWRQSVDDLPREWTEVGQ